MSDINNTEAYAVFDSSNGSLIFFKDDEGKYSNGQTDGTKIYYTGFETAIYDEYPFAPWYNKHNSITSVSFEDQIRPLSTAYWFVQCQNQSLEINLENLDTSLTTNMAYMFSWCNTLTALDLSSFDTSNVTNMNAMFSSCENLTSIDVSNFNTSNVTNMSSMFNNCSKLTSLDLSSFNTSNVTNMRSMFYICERLTSLNVSHFDTSNVTDMNSMFYYCNSLTSLDLSNFDTGNVTNMNQMFNGCSALTSLYLSSFNTNNVTNMGLMFTSCSNLTTIYVSDNWDVSGVESSTGMFIDCTNLVGGNGTTYNSSYTNKTYARIDNSPNQPGYFTKIEKLFKISQSLPSDLEYISSTLQSSTGKSFFKTPIYDSQNHRIQAEIWSTDLDYTGEQFTLNIKAQANNNVNLLQSTKQTKIRVNNDMIYSKSIKCLQAYAVFDSSDGSLKFFKDDKGKYINGQISGTKTYYTGIETTNYASTSSIPWYSNRTSVTSVIFEDKVAPISTAYWFSEMNNASFTSIMNLDKLDTSNVTNMYSMFYYCIALTSLDLSSFDTNNVTNMSFMFSDCTALTSLDLSNFNTSNVTDMSYMFQDSFTLTTVYVSDDWNVSSVTSSNHMFDFCSNLIGGQGTVYNSSIIDKTRAVIDGGVSNPGYLTYKAVSNNS